METETAQIVAKKHGTRTFRDRTGIWSLVVASTVSNVGNGITNLAIPWFVLVTTGSAAKTGIVGGLSALAVVLSGMFGGTAVDRLGFKATSIFSDFASMLTVALIPTLYWLDLLDFWMLLALVFLGAAFDAPGGAARTSMVPQLSKRSGTKLERSNAAMQLSTNVSNTLLGPVAAGLLIGIIGAANVLYIDALTFAFAIFMVATLIPLPFRRSTRGVDPAQATGHPALAEKTSYLADMAAGYRFFINDSFLRLVVPISMLYNFLFAPMFAVVMPVFVRDEFNNAGALGLIVASFGAGAAIGTVAFGTFGHRVSRYWLFLVAVVFIAIGFWIVALSTQVVITVIGMAIVGLAIGPTNALGMVLMQIRVPEAMLGRVLSMMFAAGAIATPLGVLLSGFYVEAFSYRSALIIGGIGTTIAALWVILSPGLRAIRSELEHTPIQESDDLDASMQQI